MALDSDINNPDNALWVEFFDDTVLQTFLSEQEGRPIYHDVVNVRIRIPANDQTVVTRAMDESDKLRFPRQWAFYEAKSKTGEHPGTPISEMAGVTKGVAETLKSRGFYTVEQFAAASDQVLSSLGMNAGVSPTAFRDQCKRFLGAAAEMAPTVRLEAELKQRDAAMAAMQAQLDQMAKMLAEKQAAPAETAVVELVGDTPAPRAPRTGAIPPKSDKAA